MSKHRLIVVVILLAAVSGCTGTHDTDPTPTKTAVATVAAAVPRAKPATPLLPEGPATRPTPADPTPAKGTGSESFPPARTSNPDEQPTVTEQPSEEPKFEPLPITAAMTPLNPAKTLFLEKIGDRRRIHLDATVCMREGPLEVFLCKQGTKEHEAILTSEIDARLVHAALEVCGAKAGSPVRFFPEYVPATGAKVKVTVQYRDEAGKIAEVPAQEWIRDMKTKKTMTHEWVFGGSRFLKDPEKPNAPPYYTANNGEIISIANFVDAMLDLPIKSSREQEDLMFEAFKEKIPPLKAPVRVILEPMK